MKAVEVHLSPVFRRLRGAVQLLRDDILADGSGILKRELQTSIRQRWYRTGAALTSLQEVTTLEGNRKVYAVGPTATNKGAPYPLFGEYGTGRRGAATGRPTPVGYRYGKSAGMDARRYARIAVALARPQIQALAQRYARNFTV